MDIPCWFAQRRYSIITMGLAIVTHADGCRSWVHLVWVQARALEVTGLVGIGFELRARIGGARATSTIRGACLRATRSAILYSTRTASGRPGAGCASCACATRCRRPAGWCSARLCHPAGLRPSHGSSTRLTASSRSAAAGLGMPRCVRFTLIRATAAACCEHYQHCCTRSQLPRLTRDHRRSFCDQGSPPVAADARRKECANHSSAEKLGIGRASQRQCVPTCANAPKNPILGARQSRVPDAPVVKTSDAERLSGISSGRLLTIMKDGFLLLGLLAALGCSSSDNQTCQSIGGQCVIGNVQCSRPGNASCGGITPAGLYCCLSCGANGPVSNDGGLPICDN